MMKQNIDKQYWQKTLRDNLPAYENEIRHFLEDEVFGFAHSLSVLHTAINLTGMFAEDEKQTLQNGVIEQIAIFHDIGKFFQEMHTLENISLAENVYLEYASNAVLTEDVRDAVIDGIRGSDFYNSRLDPSGHPPRTIEGNIVRAADKMQDNLVSKVDRYFDYGVRQRGVPFFMPELSHEERATFSFDNFAGDELNVLLSIIGLRPKDLAHPVLQQAYEQWSKVPKMKVIDRIMSLAEEVGEEAEHIEQIREIIAWYRAAFDC